MLQASLAILEVDRTSSRPEQHLKFRLTQLKGVKNPELCSFADLTPSIDAAMLMGKKASVHLATIAQECGVLTVMEKPHLSLQAEAQIHKETQAPKVPFLGTIGIHKIPTGCHLILQVPKITQRNQLDIKLFHP